MINVPAMLEYGMKMPVDWISGQKTGLFIDQRENRALLERYSKGTDGFI